VRSFTVEREGLLTYSLSLITNYVTTIKTHKNCKAENKVNTVCISRRVIGISCETYRGSGSE